MVLVLLVQLLVQNLLVQQLQYHILDLLPLVQLLILVHMLDIIGMVGGVCMTDNGWCDWYYWYDVTI